MKTKVKNRILAISPETGLENDEIFLIRVEFEYDRFGSRDSTKIVVYKNYEFVSRVEFGSLSVYYSGALSLNLIKYLKDIQAEPDFFEGISSNEFQRPGYYGGLFDLQFQYPDSNYYPYINFGHLSNSPLHPKLKASKVGDANFDIWLKEFYSCLWEWLESIKESHRGLFQKGLNGIEIEYPD
jgi:hypothetical protein